MTKYLHFISCSSNYSMSGIQVHWYESKVFSQLELRHVQKTDGRKAHRQSVFHERGEAY